jgi:myo-inositol-1(or 4)-monophosphatase
LNSDQGIAERRRVAEEAARAAGAVHLRYRGSALERDVHAGDRADYTTAADLEAQAAVKEVIGRYFPGERVIGEEEEGGWEQIPALMRSGCWFTDPLDGTLEYVHGNPAFSAVVSYVRDGEAQAGAVYFPALQELFSAAKGQGAMLNGAPIRVSNVRRLEQALFAAPHRATDPERLRRFTDQMLKLVPHLEAFRMPGAPSYMACAVAAGRYDITSFLSPRQEPVSPDRPFLGQPWETAAFVVLVLEAGGAVQRFGGGTPDLLNHNVYAASSDLIDQFHALMAKS